MKNQWGKKKRLKNLRASNQKRPSTGKVAACAGGDGISEDRTFQSIIEHMLKDIVDQGGIISLSMDDGCLSIKGEVSGIFLSGVSGKEAEE